MISDRRALVDNVAARIGALVALGLQTVLIARVGGPKAVGIYALLRVLPGLVGVAISCGLPGATPYFLASRRDDPSLRPTIVMTTVVTATGSAFVWLALTPALQHVFFRSLSMTLVALIGVAVFTQLFVAVGKSCLQGSDDMRGAAWAIVAEEAAFLPAYLVLLPFLHGVALMLTALVVADVVVSLGIAWRLVLWGFDEVWGAPSRHLAYKMAHYGMRGQVGGVMELLNLRLDFAILGALAGPAVLGTYAVASKYAELLRLPGLAITYVLYPRFARLKGSVARERVAHWLPRLAVVGVIAAVPLFATVNPLLPLIYGSSFKAAITPTYILLIGLSAGSVSGLVSAYLYGEGRPGLNSSALGFGLLVTVVLDVVLIPRYGAIGAAWASTSAYLTTCLTLLACFWWLGRMRSQSAGSELVSVR